MTMASFRNVSLIDIVAFWGAITGTVSLTVAYLTFKRDAVNIKVDARKNWYKVDSSGYNPKEKLVVIWVYNKGRRPVTITMIAYTFLKKSGSVILPPHGNHRELFEGKSTQYLIKQTEVDDFSEISYFAAYDAVGNNYKKYISPFYKRFFYWLVFAIHLKKKNKTK